MIHYENFSNFLLIVSFFNRSTTSILMPLDYIADLMQKVQHATISNIPEN